MAQTIEIIPDRLERAIANLRANVTRDASGCLLWTGYIQPNGYGWVNSPFKIAAHRLALIAEGIEVPDNMDVCHRCDVRRCVEPAHLYVGTRSQNMADCTERGRHNKPHGDKHWCTKLTADQVREVRTRRALGESTVTIAAQFKVNPATISRIARGMWRSDVA